MTIDYFSSDAEIMRRIANFLNVTIDAFDDETATRLREQFDSGDRSIDTHGVENSLFVIVRIGDTEMFRVSLESLGVENVAGELVFLDISEDPCDPDR